MHSFESGDVSNKTTMRPSGNSATSLGRSLSVPFAADNVRRRSNYENENEFNICMRKMTESKYYRILKFNGAIVHQNTLIL